MAGYAPHGAATENVPGAVVLLAAPVDLALLNTTAPNDLAAGANAVALTNYLNNSCVVFPNNPLCNAQLTEASPTFHLNAGDPPVYSVASRFDERMPIGQQQRLVDATGADVEVELVELVSLTTVSECIEYSNAAGCDSNAWVHSAVPTQLDTNNLASWLDWPRPRRLTGLVAGHARGRRRSCDRAPRGRVPLAPNGQHRGIQPTTSSLARCNPPGDSVPCSSRSPSGELGTAPAVAATPFWRFIRRWRSAPERPAPNTTRSLPIR